MHLGTICDCELQKKKSVGFSSPFFVGLIKKLKITQSANYPFLLALLVASPLLQVG